MTPVHYCTVDGTVKQALDTCEHWRPHPPSTRLRVCDYCARCRYGVVGTCPEHGAVPVRVAIELGRTTHYYVCALDGCGRPVETA